jgi:UDP-N-acetylmuramate dehydrogenase
MIKHNVDLQAYNTFGLSATAESFVEINSFNDLTNLPLKSTDDHLILGGGSNILFTQNPKGLVLKNNLKGIEIVRENDEFVFIKAAAGEVWHQFVLHCIANNWAGVENLSLIPGSVGASPMQNIGAYGVEIKDVFEELEAFHLDSKELHRFNTEECQFGYRESVFKRRLKGQYFITSVTYRLRKKAIINSSYGAISTELEKVGISNPTIKDISDAVIAIRSSKLPNPKEIGNAGSFFKNPVITMELFLQLKEKHPAIPSYPIDAHSVKIPAGWLIEQDGWKGKTIENYGVHKNQALVLVNYGGAKGSDIYQLSTQIIESIQRNFGIELEREVNVL